MILRRRRFLCSDLFDFIGVFGIQQHDLLAEVLFDITTNVHRLFAVDEIDGDTVLAKATGSSDAMQVGFAIGTARLIDRQIEVHNNVDLIDVDASR